MANPVRVTDDTRSIHNIGQFIMSYQPYQNAFLNALVNRIGMTIVTSKLWSNPWNVFKRGYLEFGETVEEIFVNIAKPHSFNPATAEKEVFKREIPDVRAAFHTMNFQKFYKVTVSQEQLRQAFLSWQGITDLIAKIVDSLYTAMEKDEYVTMKYMLCREILNGRMYTSVPTANNDAAQYNRNIIQNARALSSKLTFLTDTYNQAGVQNSTARQDQYIIIDSELEAQTDVDVLARAFNMERSEFLGHLIIVDSFSVHDTARLAELFADDSTYTPFAAADITALEGVKFALVDRDWWMVFDNLTQMTQNYNGEGLYWNYWNHVWKTFSVSPYANAIVAVASAGTVSTVAVSPTTATATAEAGYIQTIALSATVTATGIVDKTPVWAITGGTAELASNTKVDAGTGVVTIGENQEAGTIIVTASCSGKSGSCTITVSAE